MRYSDPERNPRKVCAGTFETKVTSGDKPWMQGEERTERRPIHILTTRHDSHLLAQELRKRTPASQTDEVAAS